MTGASPMTLVRLRPSDYTRCGFDLVRTVQVPGSDLRFWCFLREPSDEPAKVPV